MRSARPKVLHEAAGLPLIEWVLRLARSLDPASVTVVLGHGAEAVGVAVEGPGVRCVVQEPQLGTGHALLQARPALEAASGRVLLLSGDVPLLTASSVARVLDAQRSQRAALVVATAEVPDPTGYGRIIREGGALVRIVEHRDATPAERGVREINSGVYVFELAPLFAALARLGSSNAQGEYYLPDLVAIHRADGRVVDAVKLDDADEIRGINTRAELADVGRVLRARINGAHMAAGVTLVDPATAYIGPDVTIGQDTVLHPFVVIDGRSAVEGRELHRLRPHPQLAQGHSVTVFNPTVVGGIDDRRRRPDWAICQNSTGLGDWRAGARRQLRRDQEDDDAWRSAPRVLAITYLGDASVGERANVGAGTITCNYDGRKHTSHRQARRRQRFHPRGRRSAITFPLWYVSGAGRPSPARASVASCSSIGTTSPR